MEAIKFYCDNKPKVGEIVQVIFTERGDDHAVGYLTEYNGNIIMPFSQATKRKKIRSINKLIPLNKPMAAIVENYDNSSDNGDVSRAYLDEAEENYQRKFIENYKIFSGIFQICKGMKLDFTTLWKDTIHPFILSINNDEEELLINFVNKLDELGKIIDNTDLFQEIKNKFEFVSQSQSFKKTVGIISNEGIMSTKKLFETSLEHDDISEYRNDINIRYFSTPNYSVETKLSEDVLNMFIKVLQDTAKEMKNVYVKVN